ncbi:hypothetical protein GGE16_001846 [Rhizobium leguminosarum]|uniref:Uncharacterized protein n=1 Tax=Rhizobium leguminosarum TaxID=384 RepID=A0AAE2MIB5_RHILE|nr:MULTISPECIES: hypothetical protein [Rhizobium]MBB4289806.1 hypothetical protein [Rhizobium leguminosarum]MBB4296449.1 hypothetical protein [Rhizobium leguminosarum]MBB4308290.1 hypothetical protein [Rhizobium leguminosarum]MBB4416127.1 hypothetical protein [Rhizobium leguminosarum]MBB4430907.1 hypothetical protein [Rhizobium esperanzae]
MSISEGYALKYFVLYALVCSVVGIVLLVFIHQVTPFKMDGPNDQATDWSADKSATGSPDETATGSTDQPDNLVVRSTREPSERTGAQPPDQWNLRPTNQPAQPSDQPGVRKGGRVGTPAQ